MNLSCPEQAEITSLRQAEQAFPNSFLTKDVSRDLSGNLTKVSFEKLLAKAKEEKKYLDQNAFSFQQLVDSVHREFCFTNQQFLFLLREYTKKPTGALKTKILDKNQTLQDLVGALGFFDAMTMSGKDSTMVKPTEPIKPYAFWRLAKVENFQGFGSNKYTNLQVELREQMQNLTADDLVNLRKDQVEYSKEKNRAATNLLGVYGFLNLTAIGLLIYIFRSK
jgi:hypothetical protein